MKKFIRFGFRNGLSIFRRFDHSGLELIILMTSCFCLNRNLKKVEIPERRKNPERRERVDGQELQRQQTDSVCYSFFSPQKKFCRKS
jgi:hypothetical protein